MKKTKISSILTPPILTVLAVLFVIPILLVFINSFKSKFYIIGTPFELPDKETFVGLSNYIKGLSTSGFFEAFLRSVFITVGSVILIVICTSMTAWYITRVKTVFRKMIYYLFVDIYCNF